LCDKTYGRRDYLQRHLKSHNANYADNLGGSAQSISQLASPVKGITSNAPGGRIVKKVNMNPQGNFTMVQVQQAHGKFFTQKVLRFHNKNSRECFFMQVLRSPPEERFK
jgi:hypothetical protein